MRIDIDKNQGEYMSSVFISGSINIASLSDPIKASLENIISQNLPVLIGDAKGIDSEVQTFFSKNNYTNLTVYTITRPPRFKADTRFKPYFVNYRELEEYKNLSDTEKVRLEFSERKKQSFKDLVMSKEAHFYLVIWDGKSEGTKNNILRGLKLGKKIHLFLNDEPIDSTLITYEWIKTIYESNTGVGIREIRDRLLKALGEENIPSKEMIIREKKLKEIFSTNSKTFLQGRPDFDQYLIHSTHKGKEITRYNPQIVEKLRDEIIAIKEQMQEELPFI